MNQELWFPQPIWYEDNDVDFTEAIEFCKKLQEESKGRIVSNRNGWQSDDINLDKHKELINVTSIVKDKLCFVASQLNQAAFKSAYIDNAWVNINSKNSYNLQHNHPRSFLSGCIYLQVPENSGDIIFHRPDYLRMFPVPDDIYNCTLYTKTVYKPRKGLILIFPAWLEHEVEMSNAEDDRISIAFNFCLEVNKR